ncbi:superoxide dismutase, mitochondrial [Culex quinquefasciatus]|uniref:Superoxide dismutase n=1 Tax=Culex quinquefasciatus TaxID=7176 RepID=B0W9R1_CULQU|nr:superoxide dismutase, mitochondrial [Culex quinquefasciatus]|eukprot:XP_001845445.1 superoxide dismutase, mitochondrial [Culex quinquefasciatus]
MWKFSSRSVQLLSSSICRTKHTLPELPYEYAALEPTICREIMELHHQKHHAGYVNNLNAAEEQLTEALASNRVTDVIRLSPALKFNGGGHLNHSLFWENLTPLCTAPSKALEASLKHNFYSMEDFKALVRGAALNVQGSGWVWLGWDKDRKLLRIAACANQDPLEATTGLMPLLGIDVWEHAYYLQYKNDRAQYFDALWEIINWKEVSKRYEKLRCSVNK